LCLSKPPARLQLGFQKLWLVYRRVDSVEIWREGISHLVFRVTSPACEANPWLTRRHFQLLKGFRDLSAMKRSGRTLEEDFQENYLEKGLGQKRLAQRCFISVLLNRALSPGVVSSDHPSVGAKHLTIDPGAVGTGQESDGSSDVLRCPQALKRIHFRKTVDELLRFSLQE
jgi:hypothetical protein